MVKTRLVEQAASQFDTTTVRTTKQLDHAKARLDAYIDKARSVFGNKSAIVRDVQGEAIAQFLQERFEVTRARLKADGGRSRDGKDAFYDVLKDANAFVEDGSISVNQYKELLQEQLSSKEFFDHMANHIAQSRGENAWRLGESMEAVLKSDLAAVIRRERELTQLHEARVASSTDLHTTTGDIASAERDQATTAVEAEGAGGHHRVSTSGEGDGADGVSTTSDSSQRSSDSSSGEVRTSGEGKVGSVDGVDAHEAHVAEAGSVAATQHQNSVTDEGGTGDGEGGME